MIYDQLREGTILQSKADLWQTSGGAAAIVLTNSNGLDFRTKKSPIVIGF